MAYYEDLEDSAYKLAKLVREYGPLKFESSEEVARSYGANCLSIVFDYEGTGDMLYPEWTPLEPDGTDYPTIGYVITSSPIKEREAAQSVFISARLSCEDCEETGESSNGEPCEKCKGECFTDDVIVFANAIEGLPANGSAKPLFDLSDYEE